MSDLSSRVTELEIQLTHLTRVCEQLNEVVTEQAIAADRQSLKLERLIDQVKELRRKPEPPGDPLDEKPPHY